MRDPTPVKREVLVGEDEPNLRELVRDVLGADGLEVTAFATAAEVEARLDRRQPDLVLLDIKLPDGDGLELLERLRRRGLRSPVVVMTAFGTIERAVRALRAGAADFLVKPFDNGRLRAAVAAALESGGRLEEIELRAGTIAGSGMAREIVGAERGLRDVVALLPRVASSDATVLIQGESGTGKELIARAIHTASLRLDGPFVSINCAAIAPSLLESELFGFERGAFTGAHAQRKGHVEAADGGTLFLDEIGDMSLEAQSRLLRVLQEREVTRVGGRSPVKVDVRVIAATHRDLAADVADKRFREDLLYRLDVVRIRLPPLRERAQDIPGLVDHFLRKYATRHGRAAPVASDDVLRAAAAHPWPGNVRELENFVERAVVVGTFDRLALEARLASPRLREEDRRDEKDERSALAPSHSEEETVAIVRPLREAVAEAERRAVVAALRHAGGNKAEAARLLGVSYKTLFNKIHEHDIREDVTIG